MSTQSNSASTQVVQSGGSFGGTSTSQFKDQDYGEKALGDNKNLKRFFNQLNPLVSQLKNISGGGGIGLSNLDADLLSVPVSSYQSEWRSLVTAATGTITGGTGILCYDGTSGWIAYRKDPWGLVSLTFNLTASGGGSTGVSLPQEYWPVQAVTFPLAGTLTSITISASGLVSFGAAGTGASYINFPCANLSPGVNPGAFPVYLKIAKGRTPVACVLAGAKPQVSGDQLKTNTGTLGLPIGCAWTFLGAQTPAADGSQINQIRIDSVPGLIPKTQYVLNFLVYYGDTGSSSGS